MPGSIAQSQRLGAAAAAAMEGGGGGRRWMEGLLAAQILRVVTLRVPRVGGEWVGANAACCAISDSFRQHVRCRSAKNHLHINAPRRL